MMNGQRESNISVAVCACQASDRGNRGCDLHSSCKNPAVIAPCFPRRSGLRASRKDVRVLAPQFDQELKQRFAGDEHSFTKMVRGAIEHRLTGHRPKTEEIARDLRMSARSLQRRVQESGSTYQRVLDEARHETARYYLSGSVLELTETAYLLGYEDDDSFAWAFRHWEGLPPKDWRDAHRPAPVVH
jgi:AraC-like DNA-binding protein